MKIKKFNEFNTILEHLEEDYTKCNTADLNYIKNKLKKNNIKIEYQSDNDSDFIIINNTSKFEIMNIYDDIFIENFPVNNTTVFNYNDGFEGTLDEVVDIIIKYVNNKK